MESSIVLNTNFYILFFCFWFLCSIQWARLPALIDTLTIEKTSNDMISYTWKILHTTTTDHHDWVFLKIMSFTSDVGDDFISVCKSYFCYLSEGWIRLLRSTRIYLETDSPTLRSRKRRESLLQRVLVELKSRRLTLTSRIFSFFADELIDCSHGGSDE